MTIKALIKRAFCCEIIFEIVGKYDIMYMLQSLAKLGRYICSIVADSLWPLYAFVRRQSW